MQRLAFILREIRLYVANCALHNRSLSDYRTIRTDVIFDRGRKINVSKHELYKYNFCTASAI